MAQIVKGALLLVLVGTAVGVYTQIAVTPKIIEAYTEVVESFNSTIEYSAPVEATTTDRVDAYFEQEYIKLEEEYNQKQKDEATLNAIERVEKEFEAQKESIRERELFI